jgi:filamentous hemagglutinin
MAFKTPTLQELALDPSNPWTQGPRMGNVLVEGEKLAMELAAAGATGGLAFNAARAAGAGYFTAGAASGLAGDLTVQGADNAVFLATGGDYGRGGINPYELGGSALIGGAISGARPFVTALGNIASETIGSAMSPYTVPGRLLSSSVTYEGPLYRAVGEGYDPLDINSWNIAANHRYTASGQGGLYFASGERVVEAEFVNNGSSLNGKVVHDFPNSSVSDLLDLTNPAARQGLGLSLSDLTRTGGTTSWRYEFTQPVGAWAEQNGYRGIIAPSAQADGGVNVILFNAKGVR